MNEKLTQNDLISEDNYSLIEQNENVIIRDLGNNKKASLRKSRKSQRKKDMANTTYPKKIISSWQFWGILLALTFGGVGFSATSILLRLPSTPNCKKIYLPLTSGSNRLYCAGLEAKKNTVDSLLTAMTYVDKLPQDHPMREEIDRNLAEWGEQILALGDEKFQAGKLDEAINIANKIPSKLPTYKLVNEKIEGWRSTWEKAKEIQLEVEKKLRLGHWNLAFIEATHLLNISNEYWQTTKYQETINTINLAKEESKKLDDAYVAMRRKGIDNFLKAIEIASAIDSSSYIHDQAKKIIEDAKKNIEDSANELIDRKRWNSLSTLASKIGDNSQLKEKANDWNVLASAGINANLGSISSLELAMSEASTIKETSPLYEETQELVKQWQSQKEDLTYLSDARSLASPGDVNSLSQAISKAKLISYNNPLYKEAQIEIKNWQRRIEIIEDQPYLDKAKELARVNNITSWQEAINQASLISSNRALYSDSQRLIRDWKRKIETEEDQPILNKAITLGNGGNYQAAIDTARQIGPKRFLHSQAQSKIRIWSKEIKAQRNMTEAYQVAEANTPQSLFRAINLAKSVSPSTSLKDESRIAINRWSEQLLAIARGKADYSVSSSLEEAISIARMIPSGTSAYTSAKNQISSWRQILNPPKPPQPSLEESPSTEFSDSFNSL